MSLFNIKPFLSKNDKIEKCFEQFPSLKTLDSRYLSRLNEKIQFKTLTSGQTAYEPGWNCNDFLMCLSGQTRVFKRSESGREILLYKVQDGETCVLTTSCLLSGQSFPAASIADKDTLLAAIPSALFRELMAASPEFSAFVLDNYGVMLSSLISLIDQVAFDKIDQRLARHLLSNRISEGNGDTILTTHQQLALDLGSVREVVSRQLQDWESRAFIKTSRGKIIIVDEAGLVSHLGI